MQVVIVAAVTVSLVVICVVVVPATVMVDTPLKVVVTKDSVVMIVWVDEEVLVVIAVSVGVFVTTFSQVVVAVFVFVVLLVFAGPAETTGSSGITLWQVETAAGGKFWLAEIIGDVLRKARKASAINGAKITFPRVFILVSCILTELDQAEKY